DAALLADDALVLHALVLAAQALIVLDRPEDARAEQAVALGLEGTVVDRLRLLDLTERPRRDLVGAGDRDADRIECLHRRLRIEKVHDLLVHAVLLCGTRRSQAWYVCRGRSASKLSAAGADARGGIGH